MIVQSAVLAAALVAQTYWPGENWREATPESQGLDSKALIEAMDFVRDKRPNIHSMLIVRHGYVVLNASFYPYKPGTIHDVASVTKSVTSALTGIAIEQGKLQGVTQPVAPLLSRSVPVNQDAGRDGITIEHLLSMTPGLECGFRPGEQELGEMRRTTDWASFAMNLPLRGEPGREFGYCSPGYHLLSTVLSVSTGMSELQFARKNLFEPLGITTSSWSADPQGRTLGWGDLHLRPRDMAKIGYLYLHRGEWKGRQVIPKEWVRKSITPYVRARSGVDYGYGWWIYNERKPRVFEANGRGGQRITVLPDEDMVVVFTGGGFEPGVLAPILLRAIRSSKAIPEDAAAQRALRQKVTAALDSVQQTAPSRRTAIGQTLLGQTYVFDPNPVEFQSLSFVTPDHMKVKLRYQEYDVSVGYDGFYRFSPDGPHHLPLAAVGRWKSDDELLLDVNLIANINHYSMLLRFEGERLSVTLNESSGLAKDLRINGTLERH